MLPSWPTAPDPSGLCHDCGRSLVTLLLHEQRPDDPRHLVGKRDDHSMRGLRASICSNHEPFGAPRLAACFTTAALPMTSRRLSVRSPIFEIAPSFCLPPVDFCSGARPSQAAKSRPFAKVSAGGAKCGNRGPPLGHDVLRDRPFDEIRKSPS